MQPNAVAIAVGVIVAIIIFIVGFVFILQGNPQGLSDSEVIQRQLRGFGLLLLAPLVGLIIIYLCSL